MDQLRLYSRNIFQTEKNCWRTGTVNHARLLVDCADYYRAIHAAIANARHSIFILGWEIDSHVRLLRGEEEKTSEIPSCAVDLLNWKAQQNPDLKIYLLRWDPSIAFLGEREALPEYAWTGATPENLAICMDSAIPIGGSQHQKVILIDDELVFNGGMDIARQRWDERDHRVHEPERTDELGPYGPYHDAQMMMDGPIVKHFAELVRWRWRRAAGYEAVPERATPPLTTPAPSWPRHFPPQQGRINAAISRTLPEMKDCRATTEIHKMYMDLIPTARQLIYIENQFLACEKIADALNAQLKKYPALKVICVSSFNPQGLFEREGLWAGRIEFKRRMTDGIRAGRVGIFCTGILKPDGAPLHKRIHSKIIVVDDRYMTVGSANIANRSMNLDTECDVTFYGATPAQRNWIRRMRDDLLAEHSGLPIQDVARMCDEGRFVNEFMQEANAESYSLRETRDEHFTDGKLQPVAKMLADPSTPIIGGFAKMSTPGRGKVLAIGIFAVMAIIAIFAARSLFHDLTAAKIQTFLEATRQSPWSLPAVVTVYVLGGFIFFPVTVLSLITAAVFGAIWGPTYAMAGALASATTGFWLGRWAGFGGLRKIMGERTRKIDQHFEKAGIIGVMLVRLIPIAPFTLVNLAAGVSSVRFLDFVLGTFLAFLPAFVAKGLLGDSLTQVILNPNEETAKYLALGLGVWLLIVGATYFVVKQVQKRQNPQTV
ncbi:MAG: VTT domain-containing protein [Bdellovibrionaceae bacterium]|nr:VTT domain-containing protein [Pseudobdellovibrionaceae bacterium]